MTQSTDTTTRTMARTVNPNGSFIETEADARDSAGLDYSIKEGWRPKEAKAYVIPGDADTVEARLIAYGRAARRAANVLNAEDQAARQPAKPAEAA